MKEEIQIDQNGINIPGMGGLNYAGLSYFGWTEGMWLPIISEVNNGVYVQLPNVTGTTFIRNREITARRQTNKQTKTK